VAGAALTLIAGYYFIKKRLEKQMKDVQKLMKKEELKQLAGAFGRNLSEPQINQLLGNMERAMNEAKAKQKQSKKT